MKLYLRKALVLIGPLALCYLLATTDWHAVSSLIKKGNKMLFLLAVCSIIPTVFFRALRWRLLARNETTLSLSEAISIYSYGIFVGVATPGRLGELIKIAHLKNRGVETVPATSITIVDRLFDMAALLFFGCLAIPTFAPDILYANTSYPSSKVSLMLLLGGGVLTLFSIFFILNYFRKYLLRSKRLTRIYETLEKSLNCLSIKSASVATLLTIVAWLLNYLAFYLANLSLNLGFSFIEISSMAAISSFIALLPISTMGIGTRDAALVWLLAKQGIPKEHALLLSFSFLSLSLLLGLICGLSLFSRAARLNRTVAPIRTT